MALPELVAFCRTAQPDPRSRLIRSDPEISRERGLATLPVRRVQEAPVPGVRKVESRGVAVRSFPTFPRRFRLAGFSRPVRPAFRYACVTLDPRAEAGDPSRRTGVWRGVRVTTRSPPRALLEQSKTRATMEIEQIPETKSVRCSALGKVVTVLWNDFP